MDNLLRDARARKGLKAGVVAEKLGISRQMYHRYETDRSKPSISMIPKLSKVLGIPKGSLINYFK